MAKIDYKIIGNTNFLIEPEYSFHISNFLKKFEDKFLLAENIIINFEESINPNLNKSEPNIIIVSDNEKNINVTYKSSRYFQPKNELSKPSSDIFFNGLENYMTNTVILEDNNRFNDIKSNSN
ncbi:hypothetical protein SAMN05443634_101121 [Chishuiella changwenlii]|uniref:Uncharacterized protein n=2 Tax=Chishuiella changwenlii TaxID=1434701 RepID=A0A1M6STY7_9FLAO|nr:hypothetical protein [Chishuiella changwenlii]SHK48126.1 hypothetical protein SAMN05443634_101121 [Chishuiella changwenlii]